MKICPTCRRNYADDLSFCLEDGAQLVAAYASHQESNQEKTAILPGGIRPTEEQAVARRATVEGSTPAYSYQQPQFPEKRGSKIWLIVGGGIAIVIVAFIALAGLFVWKASNKSNADSSPAASNSPNRNPADTNATATPLNADANSESQTAESTKLEWLRRRVGR